MPSLELSVVLSEQMETYNAVGVGIPNRDEVSRWTYLVEVHKTVR
jgi:hypothetical protein